MYWITDENIDEIDLFVVHVKLEEPAWIGLKRSELDNRWIWINSSEPVMFNLKHLYLLYLVE